MALPAERYLHASGDLQARGGAESQNPHEFLKFLRESVPVEMLLADRHGQARLDRTLDRMFSRKQGNGFSILNERVHQDRPKNPYPVLVFENGYHIYQPFKLNDGKFYYYFHTGNPNVEVPTYLRPQDVVPSGTFSATYPEPERILSELGITETDFRRMRYTQDPRLEPYCVLEDIPFNKAFNRIPTTGGDGERFNYNTDTWEINTDVWKPPFTTKAAATGRQLFTRQRNLSTENKPAITKQ